VDLVLLAKHNNSIATIEISPLFFYTEVLNMEKKTLYIHKSKNDPESYMLNNEYRVVNFIGGNQDIITIIKKLIKDKCNS
jgi:hypothetical protein